MGKIVVSQNVTLDGVVEDPSGEGGFRHGGWFAHFMGQDWEAWTDLELAETQGADALLMGRRSDEYFGTRATKSERRVGGQFEPPAQVRRVLHTPRTQMDERDGPSGRCSQRGLEAQAADTRGNRCIRKPAARADADGARPGRRAALLFSRLCSAPANACSARPVTSDPFALSTQTSWETDWPTSLTARPVRDLNSESAQLRGDRSSGVTTMQQCDTNRVVDPQKRSAPPSSSDPLLRDA